MLILQTASSGSLTQLILRNTDSIRQISAVLVDDLYDTPAVQMEEP